MSNGSNHSSAAISPDGKEIYWTMVINIRKIWFTKLENGRWTKPVNIGSTINTPATETCPHIASDESYIVFIRFDETNVKNTGIFISYRDKLGNWLPAVMAEGGTKEKGGLSPRISPDGKYLFYVN